MPRLLDSINSPAQLKGLSAGELEQLAAEIRQEIIATVTTNGGHLASNLGVVELTIALLRVFDIPRDKLVWDVGHQSYVHKLLTGRREYFKTLRQMGGLSGFTCRDESECDSFGAGHASTSVSAALGMAVARDIAGDSYHTIAVIGDGAVTAGMAFEAMNHAGDLGSRLIVILNDNGMSISPTVGALAKVLSRVRLARTIRSAKKKGERIMRALPKGRVMWKLWKMLENRISGLLSPSPIWEELGLSYLGPVDGHNIHDLETVFTHVKEQSSQPTLIHVITTKGKGYKLAESNASYFHGVSGTSGTKSGVPTYSETFAATAVKLARQEPRLAVITPAMPEGNCLTEFATEFPKRFFDVGICEQHAVTFAAGMATRGMIPVVAIYSTFLQRSFDQIIHDVCLQELPVVFAIDRGGIVGDDGKTHQGIFDISYLSLIPNLIVASPKDENELQHLLYTAVKCGRPMAVRYPRSAGLGVAMDSNFREIPIGKAEVLREGDDYAILAIGSMVAPSLQAAEMLAAEGIETMVVNMRYAKPLDISILRKLPTKIKGIITIEENVLTGGFGSIVNGALQTMGCINLPVRNMGIPDEFVEHGNQSCLRSRYGLDAEGIVNQVKSCLAGLATGPLPGIHTR